MAPAANPEGTAPDPPPRMMLHRQVIGVHPETLQLLRTFASNTRSQGDAIEPPLALPAGGRGELRGLVNQFLTNLIGRRPRMHQYLGDLAT